MFLLLFVEGWMSSGLLLFLAGDWKTISRFGRYGEFTVVVLAFCRLYPRRASDHMGYL
jgi:uncharacterized membrane protein